MTSDKLVYGLAAVVLTIGLSHSIARQPSGWMAHAGERASLLVQEVSAPLMNRVVTTQLAVTESDCRKSAMQTQLAAMRTAVECRRTQVLQMQTQMDRLRTLRGRTNSLRQTLIVPSQNAVVELPQLRMHRVEIRKVPDEGTI